MSRTPRRKRARKGGKRPRRRRREETGEEWEKNRAVEEGRETGPETRPAESAEVEETPLDAADTKEVTIEERMPDDIDWSNYIDEYNAPGRATFESESKEAPRYETFVAQKTSLSDHLLWQFLMTAPDPEEERIASLIVGNLNRDGYLDCSLEEIAMAGGSPMEAVERILALMQTFDPVGVCARDIRECLQIQAERLGLDNTIVSEIIQNHLTHLENKNYKAVCRAMKIQMDDVIKAVNIIKGLEPRPGRAFSDETPQYINPDIFVYKMEEEFVIVLNDDGMPKLRVNNFYRNALSQNENIPNATKDYIQDKMRSAAWLIRSIHQRQKTIFKVMESIVRFQRMFFESGITQLRPMVLRDVAQDIGMHESTISRVTTNKYAYTPQGIFELKYFFNSSINRVHGEAIASASVQEKIRHIIENENPRSPLSDSKIAQILKADNINIARRTVAKYREMLKVLPSNKRKQI